MRRQILCELHRLVDPIVRQSRQDRRYGLEPRWTVERREAIEVLADLRDTHLNGARCTHWWWCMTCRQTTQVCGVFRAPDAAREHENKSRSVMRLTYRAAGAVLACVFGLALTILTYRLQAPGGDDHAAGMVQSFAGPTLLGGLGAVLGVVFLTFIPALIGPASDALDRVRFGSRRREQVCERRQADLRHVIDGLLDRHATAVGESIRSEAKPGQECMSIRRTSRIPATRTETDAGGRGGRVGPV